MLSASLRARPAAIESRCRHHASVARLQVSLIECAWYGCPLVCYRLSESVTLTFATAAFKFRLFRGRVTTSDWTPPARRRSRRTPGWKTLNVGPYFQVFSTIHGPSTFVMLGSSSTIAIITHMRQACTCGRVRAPGLFVAGFTNPHWNPPDCHTRQQCSLGLVPPVDGSTAGPGSPTAGCSNLIAAGDRNLIAAGGSNLITASGSNLIASHKNGAQPTFGLRVCQ